MIGGSSGIASVMKRTDQFKGFWTKTWISILKIYLLEKLNLADAAIREFFTMTKVIIVRRPLTLAWWIYDRFINYRNQIQLNVFFILGHGSDIFAVYHSDLVCIGYMI